MILDSVMSVLEGWSLHGLVGVSQHHIKPQTGCSSVKSLVGPQLMFGRADGHPDERGAGGGRPRRHMSVNWVDTSRTPSRRLEPTGDSQPDRQLHQSAPEEEEEEEERSVSARRQTEASDMRRTGVNRNLKNTAAL